MRSRAQQIDDIIFDLLQRRAAGISLADDQVLTDHPELQPELGEALSFASRLRKATAPSLGRLGDLLTDEELDAPISISSTDEWAGCGRSKPPSRLVGYTLEVEIGRGGQAVVYRAVQHSTGRKVAVKVLPGGHFATDRARARFFREAELLAKLDHPGLVTIIDRGRSDDGSWFLVMPFIDGSSLNEVLKSPLDAKAVCRHFHSIAAAVGAAHSAGIVHRDLKPANLRFDRHGHAFVLDFGLARLLSPEPGMTLTLDQAVVGSLPYASPEQIRGEKVDARSDIYALGLLLYESLAGLPAAPRDAARPELVRNILRRVPPPAIRSRHRRDGVTREMSAIVEKCLAKAADARYIDGNSLARDLACVIEDRPVSARPGRRRKHLFLIALLSLGLGLLVASAHRADPMTTTHVDTWSNSAGMTFVEVPAGPAYSNDGPNGARTRTYIARPFWIGVNQVTRGQFDSVMNKRGTNGDKQVPVDGISLVEAQTFCRRLSETEHQIYRLPSAAEWDAALRCGEATDLDLVRSGLANRWGVAGMLGGFSEWCEPSGKAAAGPWEIGGSLAADGFHHFAIPRTVVNRDIPLKAVSFRAVVERKF